ncbi:MAG: DUF427 domain-containing protein [Acidimicrobiia bacterium]|jgi:uncharacterized protein (DUF427 family)
MPNSALAPESVWDYPRPPRIDPDDRHVVVATDGLVLAETTSAVRVLETSHPPVFYIDPDQVVIEYLVASQHTTVCEFKGRAVYWDLAVGRRLSRVAWSYPDPNPGFAEIADWFAFYPSKVDCYVAGERVDPQAGGFYGGWITAEVTGPFKGGPGTHGW